jgi:spore cortex formation protein SpoVR/YcgB (stage V sporulation)
MRNFLVVYNRRTGASTVQEFAAGRGREAIRERFALERAHRGEPDIEIVVLGSRSREELLKTHSRYFRSVAEIVKNAATA